MRELRKAHYPEQLTLSRRLLGWGPKLVNGFSRPIYNDTQAHTNQHTDPASTSVLSVEHLRQLGEGGARGLNHALIVPFAGTPI